MSAPFTEGRKKGEAQYYDPQAILIDWKDGQGFDLTAAYSGIFITGAIGSGKTSGPGSMLRNAFLRSSAAVPGGMGGLVLHAKNGDCDEWVEAIRKTGRPESDIIRITAGSPYTFNFLEWIASWGEDGRGPIPAVSLLEEIGTVINPSGNGKGDNAFFESSHRIKLYNLVQIIQLAGLPVSLALMCAISSSAPQTVAEGKTDTWKKGSICWHILREAYARTKGDNAARKDWGVCKQYFMLDYPGISFRTRGVIEAIYTNLTQPFLSRPLRPLFCESTTIRPEQCFEEGKIFLCDMPVQEYHQAGLLFAMVWKRCFQLAVMRRSGKPGTLRPTFWFSDECQNFIRSHKDAEYQAVARSAGGITCLLTQQISSLRESLGNKDRAENLVSNLTTHVYCQNAGETADYASNRIGARYTNVSGINVSRSASMQEGVMGDAGMSGSVNRSEQKRLWIEPAAFQSLRRGGAGNNYMVDTVVFAGGKMFNGPDGPQPYKLLAFNQRG